MINQKTPGIETGRNREMDKFIIIERLTGFEPATSSLGSWYATYCVTAAKLFHTLVTDREIDNLLTR